MNEIYLRRQRQILLDMHIPDWDDRFLSKLDPRAYVEALVSAGADAMMVYCNSHAGQCFWPSGVGKMHAGLGGSDMVHEFVELLHERDLAVCAYYSVIFNNWAYTNYPEWRIVEEAKGGPFGDGTRYGVCCPNHPGYLDFMLKQTQELASNYPFDAFFFDMVYWPGVCVCQSCRERFRSEEGDDIPENVDWLSSSWCRFQTARERWLAEAFRQLRECVKDSSDIPVFCNSAGHFGVDWVLGGSHELAGLNDLVGGDFLDSNLLPTYAQLSPTVVQYMYPFSVYSGATNQLRPVPEQVMHALSAVAFGAQFLAIDSIEPDGSFNAAAYDQLAEVFSEIEPYAPYLGGKPMADVAVYLSAHSVVDFRENGTSLKDTTFVRSRKLPHLEAVRGALTSLREAHLPVGVITRADLDSLGEYAVIVLPNVLRMDAEEVQALRDYFAQGGRLYASANTSLVNTDGTRNSDFALSDVFGCHFVEEETAAVIYVKPTTSDLQDVIAPLTYVAHGEALTQMTDHADLTPKALRVEVEQEAEIIATTTLPYLDGRGSRDDENWASIHTSPPWLDTPHPAVVRHRAGDGAAVYVSADIEAAPSTADPLRASSASSAALFVALIKSLLPRRPRYEASTHPSVWVVGYDEQQESRIRLSFLNRASRIPALSVPRVRFSVAPLESACFTAVTTLPSNEPIPFSVDADGTLHAELEDLELLQMLTVSYEAK